MKQLKQGVIALVAILLLSACGPAPKEEEVEQKTQAAFEIVTIISGLFFSTMFTLVVVPSFYTVMEQRRMKKKEKRNQKLAKNISG